MRVSSLLVSVGWTLVLGQADASPYKRNTTGHSWAGSDNYFLHALPASDQETYIKTLSGWGAKVLRLWVTNISAGCLKGSSDVQDVPAFEDTVGTYDDTVLKKLDDTLKIMKKYGMKALISPHNANTLGGSAGCDPYCEKFGGGDSFYTSDAAQAAYDKRINAILEFKSPNFGKAWKDLDDVIFGFDLQNEPMISATDLLQKDDPSDWVCGRATNMRKTLGKSEIKVATGGLGGSDYCCDHEYNMISKALKCDAVDVMSIHGYMSTASSWEYFITGDGSVVKQAKAANKLVMIEEWGVDSKSSDGFDTQVKVFNDAGVAWLYWQFVPAYDQTMSGAPSSCGYDGFEIGLKSSKGNIKAALAAANKATAAQTWTGV